MTTPTGTRNNDSLTGTSGNDSLSGLGGNDTLNGGAGNDTLMGGTGSDYLIGGTGMDYADYRDSTSGVTVNLASGTGSGGTAQGDTYNGIDGVYGSAYNDSITGFDQQGTSSSDTYTNEFHGGDGNDTLDGRGGDDRLYGDAGNDSLIGGTGNDLLYGGTGDDTLTGDAGNDTLHGDAGADSLSGGEGADLLYGEAGNDTLVGGAGADSLDGGDDSDYFYIGGNGAGYGDTVIGGEGGSDYDVLDLTGSEPAGGSKTITYTAWDADQNSRDGYVTYYDAQGNMVGRLTFSGIETVVPCFTPGTLVDTLEGPLPVEALRPGTLVLTRDDGYQPVRWIGQRSLSPAEMAADASLCPVRIAAGALGASQPERPMLVSPQHRMLVSDYRAEMMFGEHEVLVAAIHLVGQPGISRAAPCATRYVHVMFDTHQIIRAEGCWTESFQPGDMSLAGMDGPQRDELLRLFPELIDQGGQIRYPAARVTLRRHEAQALLAA